MLAVVIGLMFAPSSPWSSGVSHRATSRPPPTRKLHQVEASRRRRRRGRRRLRPVPAIGEAPRRGRGDRPGDTAPRGQHAAWGASRGDVEAMATYAGQDVGTIEAVEPAALSATPPRCYPSSSRLRTTAGSSGCSTVVWSLGGTRGCDRSPTRAAEDVDSGLLARPGRDTGEGCRHTESCCRTGAPRIANRRWVHRGLTPPRLSKSRLGGPVFAACLTWSTRFARRSVLVLRSGGRSCEKRATGSQPAA